MRSPTGDVFLYENNVLKQQWEENEKGERSYEFVAYKNGRADFRQRFEDITEQKDYYKIVNHRKGLRMEITSFKTGQVTYHGEYGKKHQKNGWGIEYDEESGNVVVEGIWRKGILKEVIRLFNGDVMTELKRNGADSLDPTKRIPIYVGGFRYDEDNERFVREGVGCLIEAQSGIATREGEWKNGKEVSGTDLCYGRYDPITKQQIVDNIVDMTKMSLQVTDLTISSNCCNDCYSLDLNTYKWLQSIEIGNECFESVQTFRIIGLSRLKYLKIGSNSFTQNKSGSGFDKSKSFQILNCESLESIQIGEYSFSDFAGDFDLENLPQLQSIQIGTIGYDSYNFHFSSFVVQGMDVILNA